MTAHPAKFERRTLGLVLAAALALLGVFAAGMTIGYHMVYRGVTVAAVVPDQAPPARL